LKKGLIWMTPGFLMTLKRNMGKLPPRLDRKTFTSSSLPSEIFQEG